MLVAIDIFLLPSGQGKSAPGTYGHQERPLVVKSNDSYEMSTGYRESRGAGLALESVRTQAFYLHRYFTDRALGMDDRQILGRALCMSTEHGGNIIYEIACPPPRGYVRAPN